MECRQIAELLADYIDGTLARETHELIDWHIEGCPPCVAFIKTYEGTIQATRKLPEAPIPPELRNRLLKVLKARQT